VPYKKIDLIVKAFSAMPEKQLVVIGDGPELSKIKRLATPNITLLGYQPADVLISYMQRARAFVFAAEEDFGIAALEAQACGTPVIAFGKGGARETIRGLDQPEPTGVLFEEQTPASLRQAVIEFELHQGRLIPAACRDNALRFAADRFRREFDGYIHESFGRFQRELENATSGS
jgi:glycosyltransferase involved in cell wall biosynthesis